MLVLIRMGTRPAWAGFKTAEEGRANTPFGEIEPCGPRGEVNPQKNKILLYNPLPGAIFVCWPPPNYQS
jgi:hypothetical protein